MIYTRVKLNPSLAPPLPAAPWRKRFLALKNTWGILVIFVLIIGGIYTGVFTPTEAGGAGATFAFLMALGMRRLSWAQFTESLLETGRVTVMIFSIIVGVLIFVRFLALTGFPAAFVNAMISLPVHRVVVLIGILGMYVVLGMFLEIIGMMMLTLPLIFPAVVALGFSPVWFGIILVKMCEICLITPPVGLNVYVVRSVAPDVSLEEIFRGIVPFLLMDILTVALLMIFPQIVTILPDLMAKG
jgi:tripartite ATP-independent transporter DctM subunit